MNNIMHSLLHSFCGRMTSIRPLQCFLHCKQIINFKESISQSELSSLGNGWLSFPWRPWLKAPFIDQLSLNCLLFERMPKTSGTGPKSYKCQICLSNSSAVTKQGWYHPLLDRCVRNLVDGTCHLCTLQFIFGSVWWCCVMHGYSVGPNTFL